LTGSNLADATQADVWKLHLPRIKQIDRIAAGCGEQKFKVFSIG